jgi:hypothetical protein
MHVHCLRGEGEPVSDYIAAFWTRLLQELAQSSPLETGCATTLPPVAQALARAAQLLIFFEPYARTAQLLTVTPQAGNLRCG